MIERLQIIASLLRRFSVVLVLLAVACLALFAYSLIGNPEQGGDALMMPALLGFIWAALLFSVSRLFANVPARPDKHDSIRQRISLRLRRSTLWLLAVAVMLLALTVIFLSYQLMRIFLFG